MFLTILVHSSESQDRQGPEIRLYGLIIGLFFIKNGNQELEQNFEQIEQMNLSSLV